MSARAMSPQRMTERQASGQSQESAEAVMSVSLVIRCTLWPTIEAQESGQRIVQV